MKISSNFHDYYDALRSQDLDEEPLYIRLTHEHIIADRNPRTWATPETLAVERAYFRLMAFRLHFQYTQLYTRRSYSYRSTNRTNLPEWANASVVGFCGRVYPVFSVGFGKCERFAYNPVKARKIIQEYNGEGLPDISNLKQQKQNLLNAMEHPFDPYIQHGLQFAQWDDLLNGRNGFTQSVGDEHFRTMRSPVLWAHTWQNQQYLVINPNLRWLEFNQIFTPPQAWQELSMYLGNNLAGLDRKEPKPISDKLRAETKGFDKWSFKNQKNRSVWTTKEKADIDTKGFDDDPNLNKK